ncbi:aromatic ring-hydroxylating oxygenase subunit alpha [Ilumatobacter nonamiensis]|uniref:aromatic ring-hydroxylating oxygenase subunit alpha n=1 Tax=Ilumatobacter nonamiensis TaxID=467093 RepID=UPI000345AB72|nr:aromatic ring-hydroxylating dioxygenase subunit alpha [Ilumatobacter nonamiensis]
MLIENEALLHHWYVVAESTDVADEPVAVKLLGRDLVVWRAVGGDVVAAPDRCPHREAPLSEGTVHDGCLVCPYHGWKFGDAGRCVEVPSSGTGKKVPPAAHLPTAQVRERYGLVWLSLGEPQVDIPEMEAESDERYRRINSGVQVWNTSSTRMTDNFLDISHFPYVHIGTFGIAQNQDVPKIEMEQLDADFFGYEYEVEVRNEDGAASSGMDDAVITRRMTTGFNLPFTVRSTIHYETGLDHLILLCSTPIDDVTSYFTFVIWRNDDFSVPAEEVIVFDRAIGAEDKSMLEKVKGVLPLDQRATVSVQSDKPSVEWRRRFADMLA